MLLRHAKAEAGGAVDELRALALVGRGQCRPVGTALAAAGLVPDVVLVSSAVRTRQTWDLVRGALGADAAPEVHVSDRLYEAGPSDVVELLRSVDPRSATVLVVGHEPTMSATAVVLAGPGGSDQGFASAQAGLPTAAYAVLEVADWASLEPRSAVLLDVVRPAG